MPAGRPTRDEAIRRDRRRRKADRMGGTEMRLSLNEDEMDRENYAYRWEKDDPQMLARRHQEDWDIVSDAERKIRSDSDEAGSGVSVLSGTRGDGSGPERLILMRKPKVLYNDDIAAQQAEIDAQEAAMRQTPSNVERGYAPDGRSSVMQVETDTS